MDKEKGRELERGRSVAGILHWGPQKLSAEGARIEALKAP